MATASTAYLVVRRDDGFGDVFPLDPSHSYTLGRAATNNIVLKDDLCSRDHAEVSYSGGKWRVRDLGSLNGTRVNGVRVEGERALTPRDEVHLGRTNLVFVEDMDQLPELPTPEPGDDNDGSMSIKKRLGQTRFLTPPPPGAAEADAQPGSRHGLSRGLSLL
jgi:pSer/pThr/pTyr-binding forkhead associated (FHA) protein